MQEHTRGERARSVEVSVPVGTRVIEGRISGMVASGMVLWRGGNARPRDRVDTWIKHCVICASVLEGESLQSRLVCTDKALVFRHFKDAAGYLGLLLEIYDMGHDEPVPFFPATSLAYCDTLKKQLSASNSDEAKLASAIRTAWAPGRHSPAKADSDDPYVFRCFGTQPPDGDRFRDLATRILSPMIGHQSDGERAGA